MEITTGAQSLRIMKMRNAELYYKELKEATVIYGFHPVGATWGLHELAPKLESVSRLLPLVQL